MLSTHFRRFWVLCVVVGLLTAVFTLSAQATPPRQEDRPSRTNIEDIPHYPSAEMLEAQYQVETQSVIPGSRVAFQSYRDDNWNIYVGNDDGSGQVPLTNSQLPEIQPHLNRGNSAIVYASGADGHDYEIYRMNADGNNKVGLTNNEMNDVNPQWSPDGARIVFESYRDGQAEIYVMNADGTSQVRLTNHGEYDGTPSWSPDGSKIVFSSKRTGAHRIWVMNADGSGLVQLSSQAYSHRPHWSPDGSRIAYDADGNNDGWQELWVMNADGSNQSKRYESYYDTDVWVGSWSPDGRYIAFTTITFIYYQGNWYWQYAYLDAIPASGSAIRIRLSEYGLDWYPRWQTNDIQRPVSQVSTLGTPSPGPIPVRWSGSDTGGSGLRNYDVQVKVGTNGTWNTWLADTDATSGAYPGVGGQTYYFRSRARDNVYNTEIWPANADSFTTVENLPPQSSISPLPSYTRLGSALTVNWAGSDPGGSGIATYDVQYRIDAGNWVNWQTDTTESSSPLYNAVAGKTYQFRVRASDRAQNNGDWSIPDGNMQTTFYTWGVTGVAYNNAGAPISGLSITTSPSTLAVVSNDRDGNYAAYTAESASTYTAAWGKNEYGTLPATEFPGEIGGAGSQDGYLDVFLPPADNLLQNWGFEDSLMPAWNITGTNMTIVTHTTSHTGQSSAFLGESYGPFGPIVQVNPGGLPPANDLEIAEDQNGLIHAVWDSQVSSATGTGFIHYGWQDENRVWQVNSIISDSSNSARYPQIAIDNQGTVHVVWTDRIAVHYANRVSGGNWSPSTIVYSLSENDYWVRPALVVDSSDNVHIVWGSTPTNDGYPDNFYRRRNSNGTWSGVQNISNSTWIYSWTPQLAVDGQNTVHVIWQEVGVVLYTQLANGGLWSNPVQVSQSAFGNNAFSEKLLITHDKIPHVIWAYFGNDDSSFYHSFRYANGNWSQPYRLAEASGTLSLDAVASIDNSIHVVFPRSDGLTYVKRNSAAVWSNPQIFPEPIASSYRAYIAADNLGHAHIIGQSYAQSPAATFYTRQLADGTWTRPYSIDNGSEYSPDSVSMMIDDRNLLHVLMTQWQDLYYREPNIGITSGSAIISQTISFPVDLLNPTLSFLYQLGGGNPDGDSKLSVKIVDEGSVSEILAFNQSTNGWTHVWADLSPWAGETIDINFDVTQVASEPVIWGFLDEVSIGATYPDLWIRQEGSTYVLPGEQTDVVLQYGDQGGAAAGGVTLTYVLPAGMTYVSANIPPASINPLVWHLPDLPAKSDVAQILVTARVNANTPPFTTLTSTAVITTNDTELELLNNQAEGHIYTAVHVYLPAIFR